MSESNFSYYQYYKDFGYQIYLRFDDFEFENNFVEVLEMLKFEKVEREKILNISSDPRKTRILKVSKATPFVAKQITQSDFVYDKYGPESVSSRGSYEVYRYRNIGMMIFSEFNCLWELGVKTLTDTEALRVIFSRYLSYALASQNIIGFWGVPVDEGFVVMNPLAANFETIFVDLDKQKILTYDGARNIDSELHILRLDSTLNKEVKIMSQEALYSFLVMNTNFLSYNGFTEKYKRTLLEVCKIAQAYIYPEENFQPRAQTQNAA